MTLVQALMCTLQAMSATGHIPSLIPLDTTDDQVFVLRFWLETMHDDEYGGLWRGRVLYLNTGAQSHVASVEAASDVVKEILHGFRGVPD